MKHSIKLTNTDHQDSYWNTPDKTDIFSISSKPLETENIEELVDNILKEFNHSTDEQKVQFKSILKEWLQKMSSENAESLNEEKVRDFIYEMF